MRTDVHARELTYRRACACVSMRAHVHVRGLYASACVSTTGNYNSFHGERSTPLPRGVASRAHGRTSKQSKRVHRIQTHGQVHARYRQIAGSSSQRANASSRWQVHARYRQVTGSEDNGKHILAWLIKHHNRRRCDTTPASERTPLSVTEPRPQKLAHARRTAPAHHPCIMRLACWSDSFP